MKQGMDLSKERSAGPIEPLRARTIAERIRNYGRFGLLLGAIVIPLSACASGRTSSESSSWPTYGYGTVPGVL